LTNGLVDAMTIISEAAADRFIEERIVPRELLRVVPNGVDPELYRQAPAGVRDGLRQGLGLGQEFVWLAVGRFETAKDYPNMLRAFAAVRERHPEAVLLLAGRGALQIETEALARELQLGPAVRFLGVRDDVAALVGAADGYVMSSAWEGMPMVLLEAGAGGLPIVTTRVGGTAEVVLDGHSGFLAPPRDHRALASAMLRLMGLTETERRTMGERGREHIRTRYGLTRVVEHWEELYREVLARKGISFQPSLSLP
jgi:glycosyltransferase involved in cell wall biosynthesis